MKVEIYADVVCPWCYIGERNFERALADFDDAAEVEVVVRPFQLDPRAPHEPQPLLDYLNTRFGELAQPVMMNVTRAAESSGISIHWETAQAVNTRRAHLLLQHALRDYGSETQRALIAELFAAHFTHGENVADIDQLVEAAGAVGMDEARAREVLETREGERELDEAFAHAYRIGVRSVPTFLFDDRFVVQGAQSAPDFLHILEQVRRAGAGERR